MSSRAADADLAGLRDEAERLVAGVDAGEPLSPLSRALVQYGICMSVMTLDRDAGAAHATAALDLGAGADQLHEVLVLVAGLGMHTLMVGSGDLVDLLEARDQEPPALDDDAAALQAELLGGAPSYWANFEEHVPGFLAAVLRLSPEAFRGFIEFGAIPARTGAVPAVVKELISIAVDALPNHRYRPGLRLHVGNAVRLGAGRAAILEAVDLGAAAPEPPGVA